MKRVIESIKKTFNGLPINIRVLILLSAVGLAVVTTADIISDLKLKKLKSEAVAEQQIAQNAISQADQTQKRADEIKREAANFENGLADLAEIARRQDDEIKTAIDNTNVARGDADRAKNFRSIKTTTDELCRKLAELGHPC